MKLRAVLLIFLGLANMAGAVFGSRELSALALATAASPAPRVFTSVDGLETFSTSFVLEWRDRDGRLHELPIGFRQYPRLRGPYNRRNVYGAVLAFGPVLATGDTTSEMFASVSRYALCGEAPILRELGVDPARVASAVTVRLCAREGSEVSHLPMTLEVRCP